MANSNIRNLVFLGHGSSGKTSIVEAMLHKTGVTNRLGRIEDGTTVSDYDDEEKERQHSIQASVTHTNYKGKQINMVDSPGYPGFVGPALQSIDAVETAVVVINASSGIEVNTRKYFDAADKAGLVKIIVINKIDSESVDFNELVTSIQETFGSQCRCANLPSVDRKSIIDCVGNDQGESFKDVGKVHVNLIESIIEADDELMEAYLGGEEVSKTKIEEVFVKAMLTGCITPIVFTNAKEEIGIDELLEMIYESAPAPNQEEHSNLIDGENTTHITPDPNGPLAGLVFKVGIDPKSHMKFAYIRIISGTLRSDTQMYHNSDKKPIRPGHILRPQGQSHDEIDEGIAGDIICLAKIDELKYGDLIHDGSLKGNFELVNLPKPMFALAIETKSRGDETKIGHALDKLSEEDLCFTYSHNKQTKELVINGLGDLHLRVMLSKMEREFKVTVTTKQPKIPYRETISGKADGHYKHKKQSGGAGQFGEVYLRIEPGERDQDPSLQATWDVFGGSIPKQFEAPIVKGVQDVMENGVISGYPMQDVKVSIYDGKHHAVDSKEVAFRAAGKGAFIDAVAKAKPVLLEPVVNMEITIPTEFMGDITGDIAGRRGRIQGQDMLTGNMIVIQAIVPLSEVSTYNSQLKSVTGGRGSYSMELSHYDPVPPNIQQRVIAEHEAEKNAS